MKRRPAQAGVPPAQMSVPAQMAEQREPLHSQPEWHWVRNEKSDCAIAITFPPSGAAILCFMGSRVQNKAGKYLITVENDLE